MSIRSPTSKIECMDAPMTEDLAQVEVGQDSFKHQDDTL